MSTFEAIFFIFDNKKKEMFIENKMLSLFVVCNLKSSLRNIMIKTVECKYNQLLIKKITNLNYLYWNNLKLI